MTMQHVSIFTTCIDASVAFYESAVGLHIMRDMRGTDHPIVFMSEKEGDVAVELIAAEQGYTGGGLLIGFGVEDAEKERGQKAEMGLNPTEMVMPNPHAKFFMVQDPNGVTVQFVQED